jgi:Uncharacterised protein family (UPF0259)
MYAKPVEPHTIGVVIDDSIRLFRASFQNVVPLSVVAEIPAAALRLYLESQLKGIAEDDPLALLAVFAQPNIWLSYLLTAPVILVLYVAVLANVDSVARAAPIGFGGSLRAGLRLFPRVLGMVVVSLVLLIIGLVLLVVPGIYLYGALYLAAAAIVVDDAGLLDSLAASVRLTWGHWWRSATIFSVVLMVVAIVGGVLGGTVVGIFAKIFGVRSLPSIVASQLLAYVFGVVVMSLGPSTMLSIYYDLKLRREGSDLAERVQALPTRRS